jgi:hypothetical protein
MVSLLRGLYLQICSHNLLIDVVLRVAPRTILGEWPPVPPIMTRIISYDRAPCVLLWS